MKMLLVQIITILILAYPVAAQTENDLKDARQKLEAFEKGTITLEELTDKEEWGRKLITYYRSDSNAVTTKMKLPISRSLALFGKYPEAAQLATDYVGVYSNDWRGWRLLCGACRFMGKFDQALAAGTNAVRLGDETSVALVAFLALGLDRLDIAQDLVPQLLRLKSKQMQNPNDAVGALVMYSIKADREDIFIQALGGVDIKALLSRDDDVPNLVRRACAHFKSKEAQKICDEVQAR